MKMENFDCIIDPCNKNDENNSYLEVNLHKDKTASGLTDT
jgi:hypothetical protein